VTPTVLLLHAFPLDERMWASQLATLAAAGLAVVAPRLYGRGPSIDGWARQLLDEVDGDVVAVGASMGGYTALALARLAPERIRGLVLASSRAEGDTGERVAFRERVLEALARRESLPGAAAGVSADELADATRALRDRPDSTDVVRSFAGPLLVCAGDGDDLFSPEEGRRLAALAPAGRFVLFEGAGHLVSVEQPQRFGEVLLEEAARWAT